MLRYARNLANAVPSLAAVCCVCVSCLHQLCSGFDLILALPTAARMLLSASVALDTKNNYCKDASHGVMYVSYCTQSVYKQLIKISSVVDPSFLV